MYDGMKNGGFGDTHSDEGGVIENILLPLGIHMLRVKPQVEFETTVLASCTYFYCKSEHTHSYRTPQKNPTRHTSVLVC